MTRLQLRPINLALQSVVGVAAALLLIAPAANAESQTSFWDGLGAWAVVEKKEMTVDFAAPHGVATVRPVSAHQAEIGGGEVKPRPQLSTRPALDDEAAMNGDDAAPTSSGDQAPLDDGGASVTDRPPQDVQPDIAIIEIEHDADELRDVIRPRYEDEDIADTVLVFTNTARRSVKVSCRAWNRSGEVVGRLRTSVPEAGIAFLLASDFSDGRDYIGRAHCRTSRKVLASAIFLGPAITDLQVHSGPSRNQRSSDYQFPLMATY